MIVFIIAGALTITDSSGRLNGGDYDNASFKDRAIASLLETPAQHLPEYRRVLVLIHCASDDVTFSKRRKPAQHRQIHKTQYTNTANSKPDRVEATMKYCAYYIASTYTEVFDECEFYARSSSYAVWLVFIAILVDQVITDSSR